MSAQEVLNKVDINLQDVIERLVDHTVASHLVELLQSSRAVQVRRGRQQNRRRVIHIDRIQQARVLQQVLRIHLAAAGRRLSWPLASRLLRPELCRGKERQLLLFASVARSGVNVKVSCLEVVDIAALGPWRRSRSLLVRASGPPGRRCLVGLELVAHVALRRCLVPVGCPGDENTVSYINMIMQRRYACEVF